MASSSKVRLATLVALAWGVAGAASAQVVEWDNTFEGVLGPVTWERYTDRPVMVDSAGGPLISFVGETIKRTPGVVRVNAASMQALWRASLAYNSNYGHPGSQRIVAGPGGTSLVLGNAVTKLAADGTVLWATAGDQGMGSYLTGEQIDSAGLLDNGDAILVTRYGPRVEIRHLAAADGKTLDTLVLPMIPNPSTNDCSVPQMTPSGTAAYLLGGCPRRAMRIDIAPLRTTWTANNPEISTTVPPVADTSGVYIATFSNPQYAVRKLSAATGSTLWSIEIASYIQSLVGIPGGAVLAVHGAVEALDRTYGTSLWTRTFVESRGAVSATADSVLVVDREESSPGFAAGYLTRLDPASGNVQWRTQLPDTGWDDIQPDRATIDGIHAIAVGTRCRDRMTVERCEVAKWAVDAVGGAPFAMSGFWLKSSVIGAVERAGDGTTWVATLEWGELGQQLHLRRIRESDGAVIHDTTLSAAFQVFSPYAAQRLQLRRGGDGNLVALYSFGDGYQPWPAFREAVVMKVDGQNGALLWQRSLLNPSVGQIGAEGSLLVADSQGDVVVGVTEHHPSIVPGQPSGERALLKLASSSGDVVWRTPFAPVNPAYASNSPPYAVAIGDDMLLVEPPQGHPVQGISRLANASGQVSWTSQTGSGTLHPLGDGTILLTGGSSALSITSLDATTGATRWSTSYTNPADVGSYQAHTALATSGADPLYVVSTGRRESTPAGNVVRGLMLALEPATGVVRWVNRMDSNPVTPSSRVNLRDAVEGVLYGTQWLGTDQNDTLALTGFDASTGTPVGSRIIYTQPFASQRGGDEGVGSLVGKADAGAFLFAWPLRMRQAEPFAASLSRRAVAPAVIGALRVTLVATPVADAGGLALDVVATTTNTGTTPVTDIDAVLAIPAGTIVASSSCTLDGAACPATLTPLSLEGQYALLPGSVQTFTARLWIHGDRVEPYALSARAFAPFRVAELDLKDNVAYASYTDTIHRHGFE